MKGLEAFMRSKMLWPLGALMSLNVFAQELPENYIPVKPTAMGGAFTAIANDENSVWTNPAGVARIRKARTRKKVHLVSFPNMVGGINAQGKTFYNNFEIAKTHDGGTTAANVSKALNQMTKIDKPIWALAEANPIAFMDLGKHVPIALGAYTNTHIKIAPDGSSSSLEDVELVSDYGANLAFAFTNASNRANFGIQIRPLLRYDYSDQVDVSTLVNFSKLESRVKTQSNSTHAVAIDIGGMYTLADFWFPTIGFAIFNMPTGCQDNYLNPFSETRQKICGTKFTGKINNPDSLYVIDPTDIRLGVSITPRLFHRLSLRFAADVHHLYFQQGQQYDGLPGVDASKLIHGGLELFVGNPLLPPPFSVQVGLSQGFFSAGFVLRMGALAVQFATYGEDISAEQSSVEDQRTLVGLSLEF